MDRFIAKQMLQGVVGLVLTAAIAGCQSGTGVGDRPLLPLFAHADTTEGPRLAVFGPPRESIAAPTVILTAAAEQAKDEPRSSSIAACFDHEQIIDLATALRVAHLENPTIGIAEEVVQANLAEQMLARSLLFPTLNLGTNVSLHQGPVLASSGRIFVPQRESLYFGAGADARVAGTVSIPGVQLVAHLGDAVLAPRVAQQKVLSSQFESTGTRNNILLAVARSYLALAGAEARLLAYRQSASELAEVARLTENFAAKAQGRDSDAQRARSELMLLESKAQQVEEDVVLWATELSRLLNADPSIRLRPEVGAPPLIHLVDSGATLESLVETALAQRPEVAARNADVTLNETRLRQERVRPLTPTLIIGFSAGDFGGGSNLVPYRFSHFSTRTDVDVLAVWTMKNMGFGNLAIQKEVRAQVGQAEALRRQMINQVGSEVAEALAQSKTTRQQMEIAQRRVESAQKAYRQDLARTRDRLGNLIEVLSSLNLLAAARQDLVQAMVGYSQAQFQLHVALGGMPAASRAP